MTPERFRRITEAYGASPERWPQAERAAAIALIKARDADALAALADARVLDDALEAYFVTAPDAAMTRRIVASAPVLRDKPLWRRPRLWFSGVGVVGAGAAGVAAGVLIASLLAPVQSAQAAHGWFEQSYSGTAFGGAPDDWSDQ